MVSMSIFKEKAAIYMQKLLLDFPELGVLDAAAVFGNLGHESGGLQIMQEIKPTVPGSRGGLGWAQWTASRRVAYENWCKQRSLDPRSDAANYGYLVVELKGPEKKAIQALLSRVKLYEKVEIFEKNFERAGVKHYESRKNYALQALYGYQEKFGTGWIDGSTPQLPPPGPVLPPVGPFPVPVEVVDPPVKPKPKAPILLRPDQQYCNVPGHPPFVIQEGSMQEFPSAPVEKGEWPENKLYRGEVEAIQKRLRDMGYHIVGYVDGVWGKNTKAAIRALQEQAGLTPDEHWGPETREALYTDAHRYKPSQARLGVTADQLKAQNEPTVTAADTGQKAAIGIGALALLIEAGSYFVENWGASSELANQLGPVLQGLPSWVPTIATVVIAAISFFKFKSIKTNRVADERSGIHNGQPPVDGKVN